MNWRGGVILSFTRPSVCLVGLVQQSFTRQNLGAVIGTTKRLGFDRLRSTYRTQLIRRVTLIYLRVQYEEFRCIFHGIPDHSYLRAFPVKPTFHNGLAYLPIYVLHPALNYRQVLSNVQPAIYTSHQYHLASNPHARFHGNENREDVQFRVRLTPSLHSLQYSIKVQLVPPRLSVAGRGEVLTGKNPACTHRRLGQQVARVFAVLELVAVLASTELAVAVEEVERTVAVLAVAGAEHIALVAFEVVSWPEAVRLVVAQ